MYDFPANIGTSRHENDIITALVRLQRIGLPDNPIAFYGSSSFRIWGSIAEDLGSLDIVNLGFGGGTYLSASHYMHQLLVPLKPNRVVLYFGENDIASDGLKAQTPLRHLHDLRDGIYRALPQADVFVVAIKHSPARWIYRMNSISSTRCRATGAIAANVQHGLTRTPASLVRTASRCSVIIYPIWFT